MGTDVRTDFRAPWLDRHDPPCPAAPVGSAGAPDQYLLCLAWRFIGGGCSIVGIRSSEFLAANSSGEERAHIYAAHFAISHAGWGLTYPLAGWLTLEPRLRADGLDLHRDSARDFIGILEPPEQNEPRSCYGGPRKITGAPVHPAQGIFSASDTTRYRR